MKNRKYLNVILAAGFLLIFTGFIFTLCLVGKTPDFSSLIVPDLLFLAGFTNLYIYIAFRKSTFRFFLAVTLTFYGIFSSLLVYQVIKIPFARIWPVYIFIAAVTLFASGRSTGRKFSLEYDFPALCLLVIAVIFLLFSLDVIEIPFARLAIMMCPVFLMFAGVFLVLLFFQRKSLLGILPEEISEELSSETEIEEDVD